MNEHIDKFARLLLLALPIWALTLLLGTLTHQPDPQTRFGAWSEYVTTDWFLASHLVNSILGAAIGSLGFVGLMLYLIDSRSSGRAKAAMASMVVGNTLTTAVFGVAAFAQPALGRAFLSGNETARDLYNAVYSAPLFAVVSIGMLLFIAGSVLGGLAIVSSDRLPHWAGWLLLVATPIFALGTIFVPGIVPTAAAAALVLATAALAWSGARRSHSGFSVGHPAGA